MSTVRPASRASAPFDIDHPKLGPLRELPGSWIGTGFNLIARPDFQNQKPFFLEINSTIEDLQFTIIGGGIPNRGSEQGDINVHGLHYLQKVADGLTHGALHIETGVWIHVPETTDPKDPPTVVRQSTIPHGNSLLAQSTFLKEVDGGPVIDAVDTFPFTDATIPGLNTPAQDIITDPAYVGPYLNSALPETGLPAGLNAQATIRNPSLALLASIKDQNITHTTVIQISTTAAQGSTGILNIPFVVRNANALQMDAIFWIETVQPTDGAPFLQLQYVQRVILDFPPKPGAPIIHWPHISVATLVKQ
ncbi:heme-binding protein [Granulicella sp. dw_53]|uniref:heme-binding protein n=1 Tax=Granulicella sp. dw_53 TaxID=2719792 RepID=UPI001BD6C5BE|nr:heme-binding protein [Granulicella sp. dw_53]